MVTVDFHRLKRPALLALLYASVLAAASCDSIARHTTLPLDPSAPRTKQDSPSDSNTNNSEENEIVVDDDQVSLEALALTDETPRQLFCRRNHRLPIERKAEA